MTMGLKGIVAFGVISDVSKTGRKKVEREEGAQISGKGGPSPLHPPNDDAFGPPLVLEDKSQVWFRFVYAKSFL